MIIGDQTIGFISKNYNKLKAYVININLFPISLYIQYHYKDKHFDIKIEFFKSICIGMYINK